NNTIFNFALILLFFSAISFYLVLDSFAGLIVVNTTLGIGLSLVLPYIEVIALTHIGKERYGKIRLYGSVGFIVVALLLVQVLDNSYVAISFLVFVTFFTSIFGYLIVKNEEPHHSSKTTTTSKLNILNDWKLWLGLLLMQVGFGAYYNFFTIYETAHNISLDMSVYLWTFGVIIEIVMLYTQAPILKLNLLHVLQFTTFATAIRWFMLYYFPTDLHMIFLSQTIHALSFALFHSAAISYLFILYQNKKLAQQFFFGICYGLGGFIGAIGSGYVYDYSPENLFLYASAVALLSWFFLTIHKDKALHVEEKLISTCNE
ncbi:MAG: MFS transporter, partial [Campylobacterota bacterium]|nr:MFS transporter [Campylobacterota bacterium]